MPKTRKANAIYWDTAVFLAWLQNEVRMPGEMEGIAELATLIDQKKLVLVTSVVTKVEVLKSRLAEDAIRLFGELFKRRNVILVSLDARIADLAHDIRDYYQRIGKNVRTADAIHLATAIHYGVEKFYTFDGTGRRSGLISLSGNVAGHDLIVCAPMVSQYTLRFSS